VTDLPDKDSLQRQLAEAHENLRLIQERKAEFVLSTDVPLQLVKEERRLLDVIAELEQQLTAQPTALEAERERALPTATGYVFISYAREDQIYARKLANDLRARGFETWMDDRIDFGDRWWQTIVQAVRASAAFIVVMTPDAEQSEWVEKEILLAQRERKPIFPLLLRGQEFPLLITVQYADVTSGQMPPAPFYERLARVASAKPKVEETPPKLGGYWPPGYWPALPVRPKVEETPPKPQPIAEVQVAQPTAPERRPLPEPELVLIPASEFLMGSDPWKDKDAQKDEQPQHKLYLPDYHTARTPVTNAQYAAFVQAAGHKPPDHWEAKKPPRRKEDHPVVNVSWDDAMAYCEWLAEVTGKPYRLPSEAEWEKAARGTDGRKYPWGNKWDTKRCNVSQDFKGGTTRVGACRQGASFYGLLDMAGNVWEWTLSLYRPYPYQSDDGREDPHAGDNRVLRGGSWYGPQRYARVSSRIYYRPGSFNDHAGFRLVVAAV
jgi:formylglycine-generating enzyme required for sulfatase activity